jgi:subtilase family serine protease
MIYLVEAQSSYDSDLFCAVSVASALVKAAGGGEVSMSWGGEEFPGETAIDPLFTTSRVVYFAGTGDGPGVIYPSASPNVVAVGGTTLSINPVTGRFIGENTWQETGGGVSAFEPRPGYQDGIAFLVGNKRGAPDVVAEGNPYTGLWVADSLVLGPGTWYVVGGTSAATPLWAGIVNAAGNFATSTRAELQELYSGRGPYGFTDITFGNCGPYMSNVATPGWDFCSGLGSPKASPWR